MKAKVNTNFLSLPEIKVKDCKEGVWLLRTCGMTPVTPHNWHGTDCKHNCSRAKLSKACVAPAASLQWPPWAWCCPTLEPVLPHPAVSLCVPLFCISSVPHWWTLKSGAAAKLFLQEKAVWQAQDPGVWSAKPWKCWTVSSAGEEHVWLHLQVWCKQSLEHSTHKINLLILSKSQQCWDTSTLRVWSTQHQPGHTTAWSLVHGWVLDTENSSSAFFGCCRSE